MRPKDRLQAAELDKRLLSFSKEHHPLRGVRRKAKRSAFVQQLIDSLRRVQFVKAIRERDICDARADPSSDLFDPIRASLLFDSNGETDEAFWQVFLFTHFSKHGDTGWQLVREVYGGLGRRRWGWSHVSGRPSHFSRWLDDKHHQFKGKFGNHRKYESLRPDSRFPTSEVAKSYIDWVGPAKSHEMLLAKAEEESDGSPTSMFAWLMRDMKKVARFGRLARFDHLCMVGKLGLADIAPGSPFLQGATGPLRGARLLIDGDAISRTSAGQLDAQVIKLGNHLGVGMQELEDSMCNWQKSPEQYVPFRG